MTRRSTDSPNWGGARKGGGQRGMFKGQLSRTVRVKLLEDTFQAVLAVAERTGKRRHVVMAEIMNSKPVAKMLERMKGES